MEYNLKITEETYNELMKVLACEVEGHLDLIKALEEAKNGSLAADEKKRCDKIRREYIQAERELRWAEGKMRREPHLKRNQKSLAYWTEKEARCRAEYEKIKT